MRGNQKIPRCYGDYGRYGKLCELECYWRRSCQQQESTGGVSAPISDDQFPKSKGEVEG